MAEESSTHFIHEKIEADLTSKKVTNIVTRFPPEPNGYLHIGHAKAIHLDFGTALKYNGRCHLRFDDTNPEAEDVKYVKAIQEDIRWLGYDWGDHLYWASSYFDKMEKYARSLMKKAVPMYAIYHKRNLNHTEEFLQKKDLNHPLEITQ